MRGYGVHGSCIAWRLTSLHIELLQGWWKETLGRFTDFEPDTRVEQNGFAGGSIGSSL